MRATWLLAFGLTVLAMPARPVWGQRLSRTFDSLDPPEFIVRDRHSHVSPVRSDRPRECAGRPFLIAAGALGGALGGYLGYEILWGMWPGSPSGYWGRPFRTTLMVGVALFGAIGSARQLARLCNTGIDRRQP